MTAITNEPETAIPLAAAKVIERIKSSQVANSNEDYTKAWLDILELAEENKNSLEDLHDFYRLLDAHCFSDTKNPWYLTRDIVGEELIASPCDALPGTLGDPNA